MLVECSDLLLRSEKGKECPWLSFLFSFILKDIDYALRWEKNKNWKEANTLSFTGDWFLCKKHPSNSILLEFARELSVAG